MRACQTSGRRGARPTRLTDQDDHDHDREASAVKHLIVRGRGRCLGAGLSWGLVSACGPGLPEGTCVGSGLLRAGMSWNGSDFGPDLRARVSTRLSPEDGYISAGGSPGGIPGIGQGLSLRYPLACITGISWALPGVCQPVSLGMWARMALRCTGEMRVNAGHMYALSRARSMCISS